MDGVGMWIKCSPRPAMHDTECCLSFAAFSSLLYMSITSESPRPTAVVTTDSGKNVVPIVLLLPFALGCLAGVS